MRILEVLCTVNPAAGGPTEGVRQLAEVNTAKGHEIEIACLDAPDATFLHSIRVPVHALGPGSGKYAYSSRFEPWIRENAKRFNAAVINGLWDYAGFGAWRALRKGSLPYVAFTHGMLDPWFKRTYPLKHLKKSFYWQFATYPMLRDAKAVLYTCKQEMVTSKGSFWPFPETRGVVVGYGTAAPQSNELTDKEAFFSQFPQLRGKRIVLFLGRIHPKKGCDLLIKAFASVLAKDPSWSLVMAGPDQEGIQPQLKSLAEQEGIADRITWTGMIGAEVKWGAFRASEVFALPSHSENFGISVVEALACAIPVLISDQVNIWREIIEDGAGLAASDTLAGTEHLLKSWIDLSPIEKDRMRGRTRDCFLRHFDVNRAAAKLIETLEEITASQGVC